MANGASPKKNVSKIRTFHGDVEMAKSGVKTFQAESATVAKPTIESKTTNSNLSDRDLNIFKSPDKTVNSSDLPAEKSALSEKNNDVEKNLQEIESKQPPLKEEPTSNPIKVTIPSDISDELATAIGKNIPDDNLTVMDDNDAALGGSIITDQKRKRFSLLPSVWDATRTWLMEEKVSFEQKAKEKKKSIPTVTPVEKRKEIVAKAAKQSALAPKDDYKKLTSKIPARTEKKDAPALTIKKKSEVKQAGWSHFKEDQAKSATETKKVVAPVTKEVKKEKPLPQPIITTIPTKQPDADEEKEILPPKQEAPKAAESPKTEAPPVKVFNKKTSSGSSIKKFAFYTAITTAAVIFIATGAGVTWWLFSTNETILPVTTTPVMNTNTPVKSALVIYDEQRDFAIPDQKNALWENILNTGSNSQGIVITTPINDSGTPATPEEILSLMDIGVGQAFIRNVTDINLGKSQGKPFILMKVSSFDTAFGALLATEDNLGKAFNFNDATSTATSTYTFIDDLVQNHDVRVLTYDSKEEGLVYGFTDRNTLIISSDREGFAEVSTRIR